MKNAPEYQKYIDIAKSLGADFATTFSISDIVFDPRVLLKCRYGCKNYGNDHMCPSSERTLPYDEFVRALKLYSSGVFIITKTPKLGQRISLAIERLAMQNGCYFAFAMHDCALCERCAAQEGLPCRHQEDARPPLLAAGIDVLSTVKILNAPHGWCSAVFIE